MRTAVLSILLGLIALSSAPLAAQAAANAKPKAPKRLFVDSVVASVNDSSILQSKLFKATSGQIKGELLQGKRLSLEHIRSLTIRTLRELVIDHQMAQSARSFGNFPADRFDAILQGELDRDQQERVRALGTEFAVSEELARNGETWQTHRKELRTEKLTMLAEQFAIWERLRKQSNLYLTPRMLRDTYKELRSEFVRDAIANIAIVICTGPSAESNAKEAANLWRSGNLTSRELADQFATGVSSGLIMEARTLGPQLKAFGMAGPTDKVSDPIPGRGGSFKVAKIMEWRAASNGRFEDPEVQALVRTYATKKVHREFRLQAQQRARDRTKVWIYVNGVPQKFDIR
ncbi:MAG: hypothetical protein ACI89X_001296 [Planctomycetota bacterium]|jgi:hypothetical protein